MARYVDADKAIEIITEVIHDTVQEDADVVEYESRVAVNSMPTANVREVVHSKWIQNDNGTWSCNRCHSWIPNEQHEYARYCLYCGADMRGVE